MSRVVRTPLLAQVGELVTAKLGLYFPPDRGADLQRGLRALSGEFGLADAEACARELLGNGPTPRQLQALAGHLTVGETYFLRDPRLLATLEAEVLPQLVRERRVQSHKRLRCWSAGCCTGEEAYTLALLLRRALPDLDSWAAGVFGTDVNSSFIAKAVAGRYGEWSFRDTPPSFRADYFEAEGSRTWRITPPLRALVEFSELNLVDNQSPLFTAPGAFDLIVCRNVLMYFSAAQAAKVVAGFVRSLTDGGWLVLGPNEGPSVMPDGLQRLQVGGSVLWRKETGRPPRGEMGAEAINVKSAPFDDGLVSPEAVSADAEKSRPLDPLSVEMRSADPAATVGGGVREPSQAGATGQPRDAAAQLESLTRGLANQGRGAEALACCDRLILADKMNPGSYYLRANLLQESGDAEAARQALHRAIYLNPDFVLAHFALGNLARIAGRLSEATRCFDTALRLVTPLAPDTLLPAAEGLTARGLAEIIRSLRNSAPGAER